MQKWLKICLCMFMSVSLFGCSIEVVKEPEINAQDTLSKFLDAMKVQDGVTMAEYTLSGNGDDFSISSEDAEAIGLSEGTLSAVMKALFAFTYTLEEQASETADKKTFNVNITTYDINSVLEAAVEANTEAFEDIQQNNESAEANKQIADILVGAFAEASQDYQGTYTFQLSLIDNKWKVDDSKIQDFYDLLLNSAIQ